VLPGSPRHNVPGGLSRKRSVTDGPLLCGVCSEPTRLHGTPPHAVYGLGLGLRYTVWRRTAWWIERVTYCSQNPNASCHATFQVSPPPGALGAAGACAAASWEVAPPPLVLWPLPPVAAVAAVGAAATAAAFLGAAALALVGARFFLVTAAVAVAGAARLRACVAFAAADCLFPPGLRT
jgi:hypothetical protein